MTVGNYGGRRYRLYDPGTRKGNKVFWARVTWLKGGAEISTGLTDEAAALDHVHRFIDALNGLTEHSRRHKAAALQLGDFERWLLENFRLEGEAVIGPGDREVKFFQAAGGYRQTRIAFGQFIKSV